MYRRKVSYSSLSPSHPKIVFAFCDSPASAENSHLMLSVSILLTRFFHNMGPRNKTGVSEFLLMEVTEDLELQPLYFILFLFIYLVTILGNLLIIMAVISDSHLHTPMYFFLSHLSFTDIGLSTTMIPKMLVNIQTQNQGITYTGCLTQICFVLVFAGLESSLLAVMAYDRYVAICHPLRYTVIMNPHLRVMLTPLSCSLALAMPCSTL